MRIMHIVNHLSDRGNGIANVLVDLAVAQTQAGHCVAVVSSGGEFRDLLSVHGITNLQIPSLQRGSILKTVWALNRKVASFGPDIIHAHTRAGALLGWLSGKRAGVPLVAHLHNVHDSALWIFRLADRVIAVSAAVKEYASRYIDRSRMSVVLNGTIGSSRVPSLQELVPRVLQHPAIVTVAGMYHRKGIEDLLCAFEMLAGANPEAHLYLVGEGPERQLFEQQALQYEYRTRIHFEGYQRVPQEYMLAADVFVLASRRDSLGLVLLEAREAGCAIVATAVDGIPEALSGGKGGVLVNPSSPQELAAAIGGLLKDDSMRRAWQERARENWQEFTCECMAVQMLNIYVDVLSSFKLNSR